MNYYATYEDCANATHKGGANTTFCACSWYVNPDE